MKSQFISCNDCRGNWVGYCPLCKTETCATSIVENKQPQKKQPHKANNKKTSLSERKPTVRQPLPITIDNFYIKTYGVFREIKEIPKSAIKFYQSKGSVYYTNEKKTVIIRQSDHWGFRIAQCNWFLSGHKRISCWRWNAINPTPRIGIVLISSLAEAKEYEPLFINRKKSVNLEGILLCHPIDEQFVYRKINDDRKFYPWRVE